jgi:predicted transcriptional regulator
VATLSDLSARVHVSFATAAKAVGALDNLGIVRERTGQRRRRVFAYDRYLKAEGTR